MCILALCRVCMCTYVCAPLSNLSCIDERVCASYSLYTVYHSVHRNVTSSYNAY